jgi:hypothetical protein
MTDDTRLNLWRWSIGLYYLSALMFLPGRTSHQWPIDADSLMHFGIIPGIAAIIGLFLYRNSSERTLTWLLFGLALTATLFSWLPLRHAIFRW